MFIIKCPILLTPNSILCSTNIFFKKNTNRFNKTYQHIAFIIGLVSIAGRKPLGEIFLGHSLAVHLDNKM